MSTDPPTPREQCFRCHKPAALCVCALVPRVDNRTGIYILQHLRERHHPVGTVRFARLGLARVQVALHHPDGRHPVDLAAWLPPDTAVLYPAPEARDLADLPPHQRPANLLLLDGTWNQAKVLHRHYGALGQLPHVRLRPARPGQYQVRREPKRDYLATIEALVQALRILEPDTASLDGLERAFAAMVRGQQERAQARNRRKKTRLPQRPSRAIPAILGAAPERVVVAYGELGRGGAPAQTTPELWQWVATRLDGSQRFEALVRPRTGPPPSRLTHMGLPREALDAGLSPARFLQAWQTFLRPDDVVAVWTDAARDSFARLQGDALPPPALVLKTAYCNARHRASGALEALVAREGLDAPPEPFPGRAGARMGQLLAVARLLVRLAAGDPVG